VSAAAGPALRVEHVGRGLAAGDYDNDGDLDIVISDCGGAARLLRNDGGSRGHWISIKLRGRRSNRSGLGAKIRVHSAGRTQLREMTTAGSYLSAWEPRIHLGLGAERSAAAIEIEWPAGTRQRFENVAADRVLVIDEAEGLQ